MRITLDALLVLDAIDRGGSFAAGAEALLRVPSAVSYTIHKLELDLGVSIFDRSGHRARLTAAGVQLLIDGRELLRRAEQIEQRVKEIGAGWEATLSIAVGDLVPISAVYSLLHSFYESPGRSSTHLRITTESRSACWQPLLSGQADLVIGAAERAAGANDVRTRVLGDVKLMLMMPPSHPLSTAPEPLTSQMVSRYREVRTTESPFGDPRDDVAADCVTVNDCPSQIEAIRHALGVGYVPAHLVRDDVTAGRLVAKEVVDAPRLRLVVAWRASSVGNALRWFLDQLDDDAIHARLMPDDTGASGRDELPAAGPVHARRGRGLVGHELRGPHELEAQTPR